MKIFLDSVGCRLNQSEIEAFARQFRAAGHTLVSDPKEANLVVVNTCTVTTQAASDSRQKIRHAFRAGADQIVVTGCWSTMSPAAALALPGVTSVIGNPRKDQLVNEILGIPPETFDDEPLAREPLPGLHLRTRAFIKAQDGCDNLCTFCVTRLARGKARSRQLADVLADVRSALEGGALEVVLTGVQLGSWGVDFLPNLQLRHLISAILADTDVRRLRLSSLEPWDLDEAFFAQLQNPRMCRHLHLPLQSGSRATLHRMVRKTTPESYREIVRMARSTAPQIALTTDLITGFPGEDEAEFEDSLSFVEEMEFASGHVFPYSPRPGTAAARMSAQVPPDVRKARGARMREVLAKSGIRYQTAFIGQTLPVLWEATHTLGPDGWRISGLTDNYLRIFALASQPLWNQISDVRLVCLEKDGIQGEITA